MLVPAPVEKLHVGHTAFRQSSGDKAIMRKASFFAGVFAIHVEYAGGFILHVDQLGHTGLHTESHFILGDTRIDFGITGFLALGLIDLRDAIEHVTTHVARNTWGIGKIQDRIACAAKLYPLVLGWKKSTAPKAIVQGLGLASAL